MNLDFLPLMKLITDDIGLKRLSEIYFAWQKKINDIGKELVGRNEQIYSRKRKLGEELTEIAVKFDKYFNAKAEYKNEFSPDVMDEIGDICNVSGITLAMVNGNYRDETFNGNLPLEMMFLRLIEHHPQYGTNAKTGYDFSIKHTQEEQFLAWISELQHVVELKDKKIKEKRGFKKIRYERELKHLTHESQIEVMGQIDFHFKMDHDRMNPLVNPLFGLYTGIGDLVNNSLILFGFLEEYSYLDLFEHMKEKLYNRDKRYNTGEGNLLL